jgi:hypothetical protein
MIIRLDLTMNLKSLFRAPDLKGLFTFLVAYFLVISSFAQSTEERNHGCVKNHNYSFAARLKNYPFNLSSGIQLVSFNENEAIDKDSLPRQNDTICYSRLNEIKTVTFSQVDKLTDILYNYGFRGNTHIMTIMDCYNPRNAIIFLDKNGKAFEYIEICFECRQTRESSPRISLGELCDQKLNMLKDLFNKAGIEYGIK